MDEIRWDIRPSPHWAPWRCGSSTVCRMRELAALIAFTQCLIVDLDRRLDAGERLPTMPPWHVQENKWRAARYGWMPSSYWMRQQRKAGDRGPRRAANRLEPSPKSLGCADELARSPISPVGRVIQKQRRVAEVNDGDLRTVVDALIGELDI